MKKEFFDLENFDCNIDSFVMSSLIMQPPMLHQLENLEHNFYQTLGENSFFYYYFGSIFVSVYMSAVSNIFQIVIFIDEYLSSDNKLFWLFFRKMCIRATRDSFNYFYYVFYLVIFAWHIIFFSLLNNNSELK